MNYLGDRILRLKQFLLLGVFWSFSHAVYSFSPNQACDAQFGGWYQTFPGITIEPIAIWSPSSNKVCVRCWGWTKDAQGVKRGGALGDTCNLLTPPAIDSSCDKTGKAGNPIRLSDGVKDEEVIDISAPAGSGLSWSRRYTSVPGSWQFSHPAFSGGNSNGVRSVAQRFKNTDFNWELMSVVAPDGAEIVWFDGKVATRSTKYSFAGKTDESFTIFDKNGGTYEYSVNGHLTQSKTHHTHVANSFYNEDGQLITLNDSQGRQLKLSYSTNNLDFVEASWGPVVHYIYDAQNRLIKVGHGTNKQIAPLDFSYTEYLYENTAYPRALTGIIDARGVRYASWTYDAQGRAIESYHGDRKDYVFVDYSFAPSRVSVLNSLGKKTIYDYVSVNSTAQISRVRGEPSPNCGLDNQYQSYFDNGELQTKTDKKGIVTLYERDARGRITKQVRGLRWPTAIPRSGVSVATNDLIVPTNPSELEVVETCWNSKFSLTDRVIEAATVTQFTYSEVGDLLNKTVHPRPQGIVTCDSVVQ